MRFWIGFVRANYLLVAVFGALPALIWGAQALFSLFRRSQFALGSPLIEFAVTFGGICLLFVPALRALRRRFVNGAVIPAELIRERPVVTKFVTLAGMLGHFFMAIFASVAIDIVLAPEPPDDVGGPMAFVFGLSVLSYLISLLCGEMALVGDGVSDAARASKRVPH